MIWVILDDLKGLGYMYFGRKHLLPKNHIYGVGLGYRESFENPKNSMRTLRPKHIWTQDHPDTFPLTPNHPE
jgi:hypothetical protein